MKTMATVTMLASLATLALLIFAGGKAVKVQEETASQLEGFKKNPLAYLLDLVRSTPNQRGG